MVDAAALWLVPGQQHPVYARFARFFGGLFRRFEAVDYRAAYLDGGAAAVRAAIAAACQRAAPRLVIYSQFPATYAYLSPGDLRSLAERSTVVGLGFDDEIYFESAKFFYQACDAVATTDIAGAEYLRQIGIPAHLVQLQQPQPTAAPPMAGEDIDISFVGDISKPGRRDYVKALEASGIRVADFGRGSRGGSISDERVLEVFQRSKINLNFTSTNPPRWIVRHDPLRLRVGQIKGRPFELAALGRFCLCEWTPCLEHWFRPERDIGIFRDAADLVVQAKRYLGDDALRREMAAAAQERHRSELAPERQFSRVFTEILAASDRRQHRPRLACSGSVFFESMGRSRGAAFLHALYRVAPLRALREPFGRFSSRWSYWRGFAGSVVEAVAQRLGVRWA